MNVALDARVAKEARNVVDGNASTTWCGTRLRIDLGRAQRLSGLGVTASQPVSLAVSRDGRRWRDAGQAPGGEPAYVRTHGSVRFVRLDAPTQTCVGELRAFGDAPDMALGHDISFTQLEEAAGNTFTDDGRAAPVERILRRHGANYARLRLWTAPPAGYPEAVSSPKSKTRS